MKIRFDMLKEMLTCLESSIESRSSYPHRPTLALICVTCRPPTPKNTQNQSMNINQNNSKIIPKSPKKSILLFYRYTIDYFTLFSFTFLPFLQVTILLFNKFSIFPYYPVTFLPSASPLVLHQIFVPTQLLLISKKKKTLNPDSYIHPHCQKPPKNAYPSC